MQVTAGCAKVPYYARIELLLDHHLLLPPDSNCRICGDHLEGGHLKKDLAITGNYQLQDDSEAELNTDQASCVIKDLLESLRIFRKGDHLNFDDENAMSDEDYRLWTGWTREQFKEMLPSLPNVRNSSNRTVRTALAIFWIKLKTDLSFSQIGSLLGIHRGDTEAGRLTTSKTFESVTKELVENFVPPNLGPNHLTPQQAKGHNTEYSKAFFGNHPTTIWDGTYLYIQRPSNYNFGRKTYSVHKGRPLVKFMSIVLPDGYVLDTIGPFFTNGANNDAGMTAMILRTAALMIKDWMLTGKQVVIGDRGFRNAAGLFSEDSEFPNIDFYMPTLSKGKQDTAEEANKSRLVTKVRWVVEAYHGRFKKFKFFDNRQPTAFINHYADLLRTLTAALNRFRPPLYDTTANAKYHCAIARKMKETSTVDNILATRVITGQLSSRGRWDTVEVALDDPGCVREFPRITEEDIETTITLGTYQLKQARHYSEEHINQEGLFEVFVHRAAPDLIRARLQSRFRTDKQYFVWIQFIASTRSTAGKITGWYCQCRAGMRTTGCCAHSATIIWYLGCARHAGFEVRDSSLKLHKSILDSQVSGFEDSDDEEPPPE